MGNNYIWTIFPGLKKQQNWKHSPDTVNYVCMTYICIYICITNSNKKQVAITRLAQQKWQGIWHTYDLYRFVGWTTMYIITSRRRVSTQNIAGNYPTYQLASFFENKFNPSEMFDHPHLFETSGELNWLTILTIFPEGSLSADHPSVFPKNNHAEYQKPAKTDLGTPPQRLATFGGLDPFLLGICWSSCL